MKPIEKKSLAKPPKRIDNNFYALGNGIYRVSGPEMALCAYLVETSAGLIQINTVPELFKTYFPHLQKLPVAICMTAPVINQIGDTQTGFEFELWVSRFINFLNPHKVKFIGHEEYLRSIYKRLELTMNGDFVADSNGVKQTVFVEKRWVDDIFEWCPTTSHVSIGKVTVDMPDPTRVKIYDKNELIFDSASFPATVNPEVVPLYVDTLLSQIPTFRYNQDKLGLTVGGNGIGTKPGVTSNFIFYYADRLIWIDPPARFFEKAVKLRIHPDQVTDYIITHCHEDHIEGFSGVLQRKIEKKEHLQLLSTEKIYDQLKVIFNPLFGDISKHIRFLDLSDRGTFKSYHGCDIEIRDNYHPIPTIGLRLSYNNRCLSISGDILYRKEIIDARLKNGVIDKATYDELSSQWFAGSEVLLHDTTTSKDPVHTDLVDVEELAKEIPHVKVYGYHFGGGFESAYVTPTQFGIQL
ncbi:MAG: hypothetical protein HGB19_05735 [Chlorobiales bacterium]|nr:hypothetical protein [Chlorobiales bacterium]